MVWYVNKYDSLFNECQQQSCKKYWSSQIWNWSNNLNKVYTTKQTYVIFWTTIHRYHQMATPKMKWKIFTCITIHQTFTLPKPWRQHSTSTSKMVGCHSIHLLSITVNTKETTGIQITQSSRLLSIHICSPTRNSSKVWHSKRKLSIILNIHLGSPCQIC